MMERALQVKRVHEHARLPFRGSKGSAGLDLSSVVNLEIPPGSWSRVSTGIIIKVPMDTYGRIAPRSGLASSRYGIQVGAGVIDSDYRGVVEVLLFNMSKNDVFKVNVGDRIAQLIIEKIEVMEPQFVEEFEEVLGHEVDGRGSRGFGSTGISTPE